MTATRKKQLELADDDVRALMASPAGRRFFWRFITQAGVLTASFAADSHATAYNEGRRSVGLALLQEVQRVAPQQYALALRESLEPPEALSPVAE